MGHFPEIGEWNSMDMTKECLDNCDVRHYGNCFVYPSDFAEPSEDSLFNIHERLAAGKRDMVGFLLPQSVQIRPACLDLVFGFTFPFAMANFLERIDVNNIDGHSLEPLDHFSRLDCSL